jgi:hypothetical protein
MASTFQDRLEGLATAMAPVRAFAEQVMKFFEFTLVTTALATGAVLSHSAILWTAAAISFWASSLYFTTRVPEMRYPVTAPLRVNLARLGLWLVGYAVISGIVAVAFTAVAVRLILSQGLI